MPIDPKKWKVIDEHVYERFHLFTIKRSARVNPRTGAPFTFFLMEGLDWVNVIALTDRDEVILVQQYRHGSDSVTLEIPGGAVEPNEDPATAATRELLEETGYQAGTIERLGMVHANPAMQSMRCHTFLARNCTPETSPSLDAGEDICVKLLPLDQIYEQIQAGEISHALVVAAFGQLLVRKHQEARS